MIFNRFLALCLFLCSSLVGASAQETALQQVQDADTTVLEKTLLWKISHPEIEHESWLFGTIHIIDAEEFFLPHGTELAMENASRFVFEIDMAEMMDMGAQLALLTRAFMPAGKRLGDLLTEEDYALVSSHFEEMGLPMFMLDRIKPLFLTVFASPEVDPGSLNTGDMKSYEIEFYNVAKEKGKATGGLETMEFQLSVFDSIPYEDQAAMLVESIKSTELESDVFRQTMDLYLQQDVDALYETIGDDEMGAGPYEDILVGNRNKRWIAGIRQFMLEGPVFFAVGAGHLGGQDGVIRLLRKDGFIVTPVLQTSGREQQKY